MSKSEIIIFSEISDINENQIPTTRDDIIQDLPSYNTKQRLQYCLS